MRLNQSSCALVSLKLQKISRLLPITTLVWFQNLSRDLWRIGRNLIPLEKFRKQTNRAVHLYKKGWIEKISRVAHWQSWFVRCRQGGSFWAGQWSIVVLQQTLQTFLSDQSVFALPRVGGKGKRGHGYVRLIGSYFVTIDNDFMLLLLECHLVHLFLVMLTWEHSIYVSWLGQSLYYITIYEQHCFYVLWVQSRAFIHP